MPTVMDVKNNNICYRFFNPANPHDLEFCIKAFAISTRRDINSIKEEWKSETSERILKCGKERGHMTLIAFQEDRPAGLIWLKTAQGAREDAEVTYIENLYVEPDLRGTGLSVELKNRAADWSREQGFPYLESRVRVDNQPMIRLNRKLGYRQEGPEEKWGRTWYWFQLDLRK
jgi:GNAT superfamily N-acetyltransferase